MAQKAINGDESSFLELINNRKESIYRVAYTYTKNSEDALDIVHESIYKAFISIHKLKKPEFFYTWLMKIVINSSLEFLRSKKGIVLDYDINNSYSEEGYNIDEVLDVNVAISKLDKKHRTVIILKCFEDFTFKQVAEILKWSENTVKTYYYRAIKKLKIELKEEI